MSIARASLGWQATPFSPIRACTFRSNSGSAPTGPAAICTALRPMGSLWTPASAPTARLHCPLSRRHLQSSRMENSVHQPGGLHQPAGLHRLKNDGTVDTNFGTDGTIDLLNSTPIGLGARAASITLDSQNRITVAANGTLFRFSGGGTLDAYPFNGIAPFDGGPISYDSQGRLVVGGPFGITFGQPYGLEPIGSWATTASRRLRDEWR